MSDEAPDDREGHAPDDRKGGAPGAPDGGPAPRTAVPTGSPDESSARTGRAPRELGHGSAAAAPVGRRAPVGRLACAAVCWLCALISTGHAPDPDAPPRTIARAADDARARANWILITHKNRVNALAAALIERRALTGRQVHDLLRPERP